MKPDSKQRTETRDVGPLELRATIAPDSLDEKKRTVDLVWSTGARVKRGFWEPFLEELSLDPAHVRMGRLNGGAPLLDAHNSFDNSGVIGVVESATLDGGEGRATVRFAKDDDGPTPNTAESIFQKVKDKIIRNVSVGYRVHKLERVEEEDGQLPVMRATDWEPFEISMVPMGADAGAGVRSEPETNICEFITPLAEETRAMPPKTPSTPASAPEATPATTPAVSEVARTVDIDAVKAEAKADEKARSAAITRTGKTLKLDEDFTRKHIEAETTADEFRALAQDEYEKRSASHVSPSAHPEITPGADERDKFMRGASDSIVTRSSMGTRVGKFEKERGDDSGVDGGMFRSMSLFDLARQCLERIGVRTEGMGKMELVGKALTHRAQSTSDFPVILENTLHRVLLAAWGTTPDTWEKFCSVGSVSDFRAHHRLRAGTFGALPVVLEGAEFQNKAINDARKESLTATTKGSLVMLTRQAIINDDLSAFSRVMADLGRAAKLSIELDVYALLAENGDLGPTMTDGNPMFDASHNNVGAGDAITVASIDAERVIMAQQTDESGNEVLDLRPKILVIPIGLGGAARQVNDARFDIDTDGGLAPNIVLGLFEDIVDSPRLTDATRHYLFADPAIAPVIEVAFLDGQREPFMEMRQGWEVDGTEWKVRMDYAVGGIGFRGALTDAGA